MESLEKQLDANDFGIFVFAPDDVALHRDKYVFIPRDNTLFEMGLFWGKLRRKRVFAIVPHNVQARDDLIKGEKIKEFHLLSDLQGLTLWEYNRNVSITDDQERFAALCEAIRNSIVPPSNFRVIGSALWKAKKDEGIEQIGGNVGKGRYFEFNANQEREARGEQPIYVLDVFLSSKWAFFNRVICAMLSFGYRVRIVCSLFGQSYS